MREKKFGKLFLTWLLAATMVLTLLPVGMLAADAPDEATEDGEAVLTPVAGAEAGETAVPAEAASMLLAAPAAADTPIAVPEGKLIFDKANGVITGIDADWLANNKDKPLSVTIPAEINGTPVTSIGQNAFKAKNAGLKNHPQVVAVDFSNATNLEKIDNQAFMHSPVASVDLSNTQVTVIGKFAFIYSILYKPCIFKAYRLLNVQTLCIFPCFCPYEPKQGKFLFSADYLIQQSCGSTLRFPCSVSVNVHCGTDISVSEKFLHIFRCCTV